MGLVDRHLSRPTCCNRWSFHWTAPGSWGGGVARSISHRRTSGRRHRHEHG